MNVSREWLEKDYYRVLGVSEDASDKDITKAYRQLARELHPDANPNDKVAEERFKEVSAAYDVLGDSERRKEYDEVRRMGPMGGFGAGQPGGGGDFTFTYGDGDLSDLFGGLFGDSGLFNGRPGGRGGRTRARRGPDQESLLRLAFDEAVKGITTDVTVRDSAGSRSIKVRIPPGVDDGQRIRLRGKGGEGVNGGPPGDMYVIVRVADHPLFGRDGANLTLTAPVTFAEAALGADIKVPTFDGDPVTVRIPPGTQSGKIFRVKGRGATIGGKQGDLLVTVEVAVPTNLNKEQRAALESFREAGSQSPRSHLGV